MFNQKEKGGFIWLQKYASYFKTFDILFTKKSCALKIAIPEFQKILDLLFLQDSIFSTFFLSDSSFTLFFRIYLKEHLWMVASVYFNREVSQGGTYSLGKYCSRECLSVKIKTLTKEILISWREHLRKFLGRTSCRKCSIHRYIYSC